MRQGVLSGLVLALAATSVFARPPGDLQPGLIRPGGLPVFFSSEGPLNYISLNRSDLPKDAELLGTITGKSCQFSLAVPIAASVRATSISGAVGNGTFSKILKKMKQEHAEMTGIYDVRVDLHQFSILGIFGRLCTEITAEAYR